MARVSCIFRAAFVLPVTSPPIKDGAVVISGPLIEAVGRFSDIRQQYPSLGVDDLGAVALMPGLINAHTHLELTCLRDTIPEGLSFVSWLLELVRKKRQLTEDDLVASARQGVAESIAGGVTAVGDIATPERVMQALLDSPLSGIVFREMIGESGASVLPDVGSSAMKPGISPHSTYTVPAAGFRHIAESAHAAHTPLAIHTAESPEEVSFLKNCSGPIAEQIYPMARWPLPEPSGLSPVAFLYSTGILEAIPLLIHGVQVSENDVHIIARQGISVIHCPGSNRRLGLGRFPLELYRQYDVNVALGTDSAIGTKRLDLFEEMREARRMHGEMLSCEDAVRMATVNGAAALGLNAGALEPGRRADIMALAVDMGEGNPYRAAVENGGPEAVKAVWLGGKAPGLV